MRVMKNWPQSCELFRQTLDSVFNSADGNFGVVVAGHEPPTFPLPQDPRFHFLSLDHPIPNRNAKDAYVEVIRDKLAKIAAAWEWAKQAWKPAYVMKLDWDDLVSSRLVDWLGLHGGAAGYRIPHGWIWRLRHRRFIQRTEQLDRVCGSCLVIRSDLADQTGPFLNSSDGCQLDEAGRRFVAEDQHSLVPGAGSSTLLLNDSHIRAEAQFAYLGHRLEPLPLSAVIWRIGHGQNASHHLHQTRTLRLVLGQIRRTRLATKKLKREFGLL